MTAATLTPADRLAIYRRDKANCRIELARWQEWANRRRDEPGAQTTAAQHITELRDQISHLEILIKEVAGAIERDRHETR